MAKRKCTPENLEDVINDICEDYLNKVCDDVPETVEQVGKTCKDLVRSYAQASGIKGKKYFSSFKTKVERGRLETTVTIHSSMYQIAHLLENGHIIKVHGRVTGKRTRAFKHFAPAEEKANEMLVEKIKLTIGSDAK